VAVALALAYVELGREALEAKPKQHVRACQFLELALVVLQHYGDAEEEGGVEEVSEGEDEETARAPKRGGGGVLAADLQEQIIDTLKEMAPARVLETLAQPASPDSAQERQDALALLKGLLWDLLPDTPFYSETSEGDTEVAALASRAQFTLSVYPLLTSLEQVEIISEAPEHVPAEATEVFSAALAHVAGGWSTKDAELVLRADVLLESLQLSETQEVSIERGMVALLLGRVDQASAFWGLDSDQGDPAIREYVKKHSGEDGKEKGEESESKDPLAGMCQLLERWMVEAVLPKFRDTKPEASQAQINEAWFSRPDVQAQLETLERQGNLMARPEKTLVAAEFGASSLSQQLTQSSDNEWTGRNAVPESQEVFPWWEFGSYVNNRRLTPNGLIVVAAMGLVAVGVFMWSLQRGSSKAQVEPTVVSTTQVTTKRGKGGVARSIVQTPEALDMTSARKLVEKWQTIKAAALGGKHSVNLLGDILDGYMLSQWKARAQDVKQHGWYWEYTLVGLKIDSVNMESSTTATVQATLQESAQLYDRGRPDNNDAYRSTYCARYEVNWKQGLGWRISSGAVLY